MTGADLGVGPSQLISVGRDLFGKTVVFERDFVDRAQVKTFPHDVRAVVIKYHLQVLLAAGFVRELEQALTGIAQCAVAEPIFTPTTTFGWGDVNLPDGVAGTVDEGKVSVACKRRACKGQGYEGRKSQNSPF